MPSSKDWVILACMAGLVVIAAARWAWMRRTPRERTRWATWRDEPYNPDRMIEKEDDLLD